MVRGELALFVIGVVVVVLLGGCFPVGHLQTPSTLEPGKLQLALGTRFTGGGSRRDAMRVAPSFALRVGVAKNLDVGGELFATGVGASAKYQLTRGAVDVSLASGMIAASDLDAFFDEGDHPSTTVFASRSAIYVGSNGEEHVSVWLAPTLDAGRRSIQLDDGRTFVQPLVAPGMLLGLVVGAASEPSRFLLEVGVTVPMVGQTQAEHTYRILLGPGDTRAEFGFGALF